MKRQPAKGLAAGEGILAGTSTGLNVAAAIELAQEHGDLFYTWHGP